MESTTTGSFGHLFVNGTINIPVIGNDPAGIIQVNGVNYISGTTNDLNVGNTSKILDLRGTNVMITGSISASGDISSSGGTVTAKQLTLDDASRVDIKFTNVGDEDHYIRKDGDFLRFRGHDDSTVLFELKNNSNGSNITSFPNGNHGIGTTNPGEKLEVVGNISASGNVYGNRLYVEDLPLVKSQNTVSFGSNNILAAHITASSNISASGNISGSNIFADGNISASGNITTETLTIGNLSNQGSEATAVMINGSNVVGTRELGSNAFTSTTIGTTTNALTVDNATLQLDSGTTFNGSAARTISIKDGGVDNDALGADAVDGTKIADDAINSEHYVDASIDTAHIADDQVTYAKIQNVTNARILGNNAGSDGNVTEMTKANVLSFLNVEDGATADQTGAEIATALNSDLGGNFTIGNQSNDTATFSGEVVSQNNISASGNITANNHIGQRMTIATLSQYVNAVGGDDAGNGVVYYYYGNGNTGLYSTAFNQFTSTPETPDKNKVHNSFILPCKLKNIQAKIQVRGAGSSKPTFWLFTGSRQDGAGTSGNPTYGFAASSSVNDGPGTPDITIPSTNGFYNVDITGSRAFPMTGSDDLIRLYVRNYANNTKAIKFNLILYGETVD